MKKYLLLVGIVIPILANAQTFIEESFWKTFNVENALHTANNGDANSQLIVALYYKDVAHDNTKFRYWIEKATIQNQIDALLVSAVMYTVGDCGFPENKAKALEYLRKAASMNSIQAIRGMANAYLYGDLDLSQNDGQALYWFRKGALLGDAFCQTELGKMYMNGECISQDEQEGVRWLQKGADQNYIDAQCYLIIYYATRRSDDQESSRKLMKIGLDFLINPEISQNSELILFAKGLVGSEFFNRGNYKRGIQLMREGLKCKNELLQFYWKTMDEYAREVLGTTLYALENQ